MNDALSPDKQAALDELCEKHFGAFFERSFRVINPGARYEHNWHLDCLCVAGHTKLITEQGEMTIADVVGGEYSGRILSYNHELEQPEWRRIVRHIKSPSRPTLDLLLSTGGVITVTDNHPIYLNGAYKPADQTRAGEKALSCSRMRLVPEAISGVEVEEVQILQPPLLREQQDQSGELPLPSMWVREGLGRQGLPVVFSKISVIAEEWFDSTMRKLWKTCLSLCVAFGECWVSFGSILQSKVFREARGWKEQSCLHRWRTSGNLSSERIPSDPKENHRKGWRSLLFVQDYSSSPLGRAPHRSAQEQQSGLEFSDTLPPMPQQAEGDARRDFEVGECDVVSVGRSLRIPEAAYNLEVEGNNNYFAGGILVHNCDYLEACFEGEIQKLIINMPPRFMKSACVSVAFPAWVLGKMPWEKFIMTTYKAELSKDMTQNCRSIIKDSWYQNLFPRTRISPTQDEKHHFETTMHGQYYGAAINSVTGVGASYVICDDALRPDEALSETVRKSTNDAIRNTLFSRFNDSRTGRFIMVMHRLHEDDPTGNLMKDGGYTVIKLPAETTRTIHIPPARKGGQSYTMKAGSLLFPQRVDRAMLDQLRISLTDYNYIGQYLQEPAPIGGGEFKENWINYYSDGGVKPRTMNICILCDASAGSEINKRKKKTSDYTAMMVVGLAPDNNMYLLDLVRDRLNPTERVETLFILHRKWNDLGGKPPKVGYEKYGMMSDTHYIQERQKQDGYRFPLIELGGKVPKETRIRRLIPDMQQGRWWFPANLMYADSEGRTFDLIRELVYSELAVFPMARWDDMSDALSRVYSEEMGMVFPRVKQSENQKMIASAYPQETEDWMAF